MMPYIGSKISLISNSEVRYVGTLLEINQQESTVSLQDVQSFGTEGRTGNPATEMAPSDEAYPYVVFRGSDVKDLHVMTAPERAAARVPNDPAVISSSGPPGQSSRHGGPPGFNAYGPGPSMAGPAGSYGNGHGYPPYGMPQQYGYPPPPHHGQHGEYGMHPPHQQYWGPHDNQSGPPRGYPGFGPANDEVPPMPHQSHQPTPTSQSAPESESAAMVGSVPAQALPYPQNASSDETGELAQDFESLNLSKPAPYKGSGDKQRDAKVTSKEATVSEKGENQRVTTRGHPQQPEQSGNTVPPPRVSSPAKTKTNVADSQGRSVTTGSKSAPAPVARQQSVSEKQSDVVATGASHGAPTSGPGDNAVSNKSTPRTSANRHGVAASTSGQQSAAGLAQTANPDNVRSDRHTNRDDESTAGRLDDANSSWAQKINRPRNDNMRLPGTGAHLLHNGQRRDGRDGRNQRPGQQSQGRSAIPVPDSDFDFESANSKFNKTGLATEATAALGAHNRQPDAQKQAQHPRQVQQQPEPEKLEGDEGAGAYKKGSFFDDISCDSKDRADSGDGRGPHRVRPYEERRLNLETFGQMGMDGQRGGYGGRRGGGSGGYRRGGHGGRQGGGYHQQGYNQQGYNHSGQGQQQGNFPRHPAQSQGHQRFHQQQQQQGGYENDYNGQQQHEQPQNQQGGYRNDNHRGPQQRPPQRQQQQQPEQPY
ncbi:hypothetical protein HKX48_000376 [Thoreauomyces humboldtii]|nr:hypothetical protein HKX48_000376 [Thoreauomyces humboldtii]